MPCRNGEALTETVRGKGRPFFGICVGMQLMATRGTRIRDEPRPRLDRRRRDGDQARRSALRSRTWAGTRFTRNGTTRCSTGSRRGRTGSAYFVHSVTLEPADMNDLVAVSSYGGPVTAVVARENLVGTQFHPEKSQSLGLRLIANFLRWRP